MTATTAITSSFEGSRFSIDHVFVPAPWADGSFSGTYEPARREICRLVPHPYGSARRIQRVHPTRTAQKESQMLADVFGVDGIIVLIVVVVLLFGGAAIPKLARNL